MQYDLNIRDYVRIFQKRKWVLILTPILAGLIGFFLTASPPVLFEATGKIRVIKSTAPTQALLDTYYYWEVGNYLDTHAQVITSQEVLKEVATRLGLIPEDVPYEELVNNQFYLGVLDELRSSVNAEPVESTSIIRISAVRPQARQAITWVNSLIDTYVDRHRYELNRQVIDSRRYIESQLARYEQALQEAEDALTGFKLEHASTLSLRVNETDQTQEELERVESALSTVNLQIDYIDQALSGDRAPSIEVLARVSGEDPRIGGRLLELSRLENRRRELLQYQTPRSPEVRALDQQLRAGLEVLRAELAGMRERLEMERGRLGSKFLEMPANDARLAQLERQVQVNEQMYRMLSEEYQRARLREAEQIQEVSVIEKAVSADVVPQTGKFAKALVAMVIGLLLGVATALVAENLDTSIGAIEDVETLLNVPVLGIIPPIEFDSIREVVERVAPPMLQHPNYRRLASLVTHYDPRSPVSEAYRALRTNLEQAREKTEGRVLVVTSSVLEEGKTTTAANLALAYAQMGRKTLLVAADLRRPDLHNVFGIEKEPGLVDVLTGSVPWDSTVRGLSDMLLGELSMDVVLLTPGMDNLHVIPAGSSPLNPAELLSSQASEELIRELSRAFDLVIMDTPPVIPVTDAAILAEHADGVILVYEVGKVGRDVLKRAKAHLDNVGAEVWGIVMNDVKAEAETTLRDTDYYYYHYRYEKQEPRRGIKLKLNLGKAAARLLGSRRA